MKSRHSLAIIAGFVGVYLLIHAGMAGYAVYLVNDVLQPPVRIDDPYVPEMRENYSTLVTLFLVVTAVGAMSAVTCIGFVRNSNWARHLWLITTAVLFVCLVVAVVFLGVVWTSYLFEFGAVCVSWWYLLQLGKESHEG